MALVAVSLSAQKLPKSVKDAKKALNASKYAEALNLIDAALQEDATANISEAWAVKGDALTGILANERGEIEKARILGQNYVVQNGANGPLAFDAYKQAMEKAVDDKDKGMKASVKGMVDLATHLNEIALNQFNNKNYEGAFKSFGTVLGAREALNAIGNKSILSKEEDFNTIQYYAGLAAAYNGTPEKATDIYKSLVNLNYNKPLPYEQVFEMLVATDEAAAFEVLEKGKKACADDPKNLIGFLYKEINFYLKKQEYDKLETKLQDAIAQDPENPTLYYALGNVYGSLSDGAYKDGDNTNGAKYFAEAEKYYNTTLEVDAKHYESAYNIGALYYNRATTLNGPLKELGSDMSREGMAKYDKLKEEQKDLLLKSVPHFEKALGINGEHLGSVEALKGVAAYTNNAADLAKYEALLKKLKGE